MCPNTAILSCALLQQYYYVPEIAYVLEITIIVGSISTAILLCALIQQYYYVPEITIIMSSSNRAILSWR